MFHKLSFSPAVIPVNDLAELLVNSTWKLLSGHYCWPIYKFHISFMFAWPPHL